MKKNTQMILLAVISVVLLLLLLIILFVSMNKSRKERDAVLQVLEQNQQDKLQQEEISAGEPPVEEAQATPDKEEAETPAADNTPEKEQEEVAVGALDDAQDPQSEQITDQGAGVEADTKYSTSRSSGADGKRASPLIISLSRFLLPSCFANARNIPACEDDTEP